MGEEGERERESKRETESEHVYEREKGEGGTGRIPGYKIGGRGERCSSHKSAHGRAVWRMWWRPMRGIYKIIS